MSRFLCLDIGDKRIGVAVSDPFNSYALPIETYHRKKLEVDLEQIKKYVCDKGITHIVCGLPVNFDGTESIQTKKAKFFIDKLEEKLKIEIIPVDERCSTCEAETILIEQGKNRKERKQFIDAVAACEILQGYLDDRKSKNKAQKGDNKMSEKEKHTCDCGCEHEHEHTHCEDDCCECDDDCCDCGCDDEIVELTADDGRKLKFYLVGTIEYKGKTYSAFEPAEEIEGIEDDDLVIFELANTENEDESELLPVEDEALLDEVFNEFCRVLEEDELADEAESLEPTEN